MALRCNNQSKAISLGFVTEERWEKMAEGGTTAYSYNYNLIQIYLCSDFTNRRCHKAA